MDGRACMRTRPQAHNMGRHRHRAVILIVRNMVEGDADGHEGGNSRGKNCTAHRNTGGRRRSLTFLACGFPLVWRL